MTSAESLVEEARRHLGKPYVFGAEGPDTFDCSGLMQYVFGKFGIKLPRLSSQQALVGIPVPKGQQRPGDMVFSSWDGRRSSHVGLYIGGGQIINAPQPGERVKVANLTPGYMSHVDAIRRMPGVDGTAVPSTPVGSGIGLPSSAGFVDAVKGIRDALSSTVGAFQSAGKLAEGILSLALPSTMVRLATGGAGAAFILLGLVFLVREVRE